MSKACTGLALLLHFRIYGIFTCGHGLKRHFEKFVKLPAQLLRAALDHLTGTARRKSFALIFLFQRFQTISFVLFEGLISAAAQISPVSSSAAKSTFSISCSGSTSMVAPQGTVMPYPWEQTE